MVDHPNVHQLTFEGKEITLIGTAHISKESADLVTQVIEETKPDTVCVELCQSRYDSLTQKKKWENTDLLKVIKEKKALLLPSHLLLASFQRKIGRKLGQRRNECEQALDDTGTESGNARKLPGLSRTCALFTNSLRAKLSQQVGGPMKGKGRGIHERGEIPGNKAQP